MAVARSRFYPCVASHVHPLLHPHATDLHRVQVLKRHARPIREVEGEESEILRSIFPKGIKAVPGACAHGFNHVEHFPRAPRLIRVQAPLGAPRGTTGRGRPVSSLVPCLPRSLHDEGCFVLDTEDGIYHYVGAKAPKAVFACANQLAMGIHFRERTGRVPCPLKLVNQGVDPEGEEAFWQHLGVSRDEMPSAARAVRERSYVSTEDGDADLVLYRVDDLQDEIEVTELQKGGHLSVALLERAACLVLDLHFAVYVWKGKGATLDARNIGLQLARDLAEPRRQPPGGGEEGEEGRGRSCAVTVLASECDDVLFMSKFEDAHRVVYADLAQNSRICRQLLKAKETSVRKMHSVTVRSWLETGQAVRRHNKSAMFVQQGVLCGLRAWSVDNFSLSPVTCEMVGHFVTDRSYVIQCSYRSDASLDRHVIYFWQVG